jgi:dolichol-phosphate mannosyltransferase
MKKFLLSVIIPVFNEENNIDPLLKRLIPVLKPYQYEIIFVDDGSKDKTAQIIKKYAQINKNIKLISFTRNFGHQMALVAGYLYAKGDCAISLDADLQDPPEIIPEMIKKWQEGNEIVYAKRDDRRKADSFFKRFTANLFYKTINFLTDIPIPDNVGDFRLIDRKVIEFLNQIKEKSRFLRGLVAWPGFKADYVYYVRDKRFSGKTHYPLSKMINLAVEGITSFSIKPLRLATYLGFLTALLGFLGIFYAVLGKIFLPRYWVTGWTALFVGIMFLGGVQLITIGIIGEYIGKIYQEIQNRPQFLIREKINL